MKNFIAVMLASLSFLSFMAMYAPQVDALTCNNKSFQVGSKGECVKRLQRKLNHLRCAAGPVDGAFGSLTDHAVRKFQYENDIVIDGIAGPQTWGKINSPNRKWCKSGDVDEYDRLLCRASKSKCILVHRMNGQNVLELYQNKRWVATTVVNTGIAGNRTRNTYVSNIFRETFPTEKSETVTNADRGTNPKTWKPGVRQIADGDTGLMGDPHSFNGGQAFHWRVAYSGAHDENGKSIPVLSNGIAQQNNDYNGGYESHGCVHVPKNFLSFFDGTFFQKGVRVRIQDQPRN